MLSGNDSFHGTITAKISFDDDKAVESLVKAMHSKKDADERQVLQILTQINNTQRQMIKTPYKIKCNRDLVVDLANIFAGDYKDVILALMETPTKYDTLLLKKAFDESGTNETVLIEVLCTRTDAQLVAIKNEYFILFETTLIADLNANTTGDLKDILTSVAQRPILINHNSVDTSKIRQDVKKILADKKKLDKALLKSTIASLPAAPLAVFIAEYAMMAGHQIDQDVEKQFSGHAKSALLALIQYSRNSFLYFANLLNGALKGPGIRDQDLIRLVVSRSEIDLASISEVYANSYKKQLVDEISAACEGSYRDCLIAIVNGNMQQIIVN
ncbi:unnamed protein product [Thelazia callipaeda]|uniref:Annexin n=1 Tax=Thelazia callipaeda TaxID=103827 RepID=A0A0N5CMW7_THECL|nr:unnamed protein product [Thelazia callipaeda]